MAKLMKWATKAFRRPPSPAMCFPTSGFETVRPSEVQQVLDEERFEQFKQGQYYPANIGDVLISKYQIIGKLGFGTTSTIWLARDLKSSICDTQNLQVLSDFGSAVRGDERNHDVQPNVYRLPEVMLKTY
ncbi:protein kinase domain protein [Penicillium verrucosum]|uniref:protein kinase domain protein n=1 Tax=Penicillium verrucosum TaxID=60171 RepID=UPI002544D5D3|nr:protein kinase domain protein [Penicillium verrucosum]KAJ5941708.1 protein kinase domain protein [Penicillium verrucosum]